MCPSDLLFLLLACPWSVFDPSSLSFWICKLVSGIFLQYGCCCCRRRVSCQSFSPMISSSLSSLLCHFSLVLVFSFRLSFPTFEFPLLPSLSFFFPLFLGQLLHHRHQLLFLYICLREEGEKYTKREGKQTTGGTTRGSWSLCSHFFFSWEPKKETSSFQFTSTPLFNSLRKIQTERCLRPTTGLRKRSRRQEMETQERIFGKNLKKGSFVLR